MSTRISPLAGKPAPPSVLIDVDKLVAAHFSDRPDPTVPAGVNYWAAIAERWKIDLTVVSEEVDPKFAFMTLDWDGQIRMDPSLVYAMGATNLELVGQLGQAVSDRVEAPATTQQKQRLSALSPKAIAATELAGEPITGVLSRAPGNGASIGGIKVLAKNGWYAARPSGTEAIYKIYAESFLGAAHLERILEEAQAAVDTALGPTP